MDAKLKALQKLAGLSDEAPLDKLAKNKAERGFGDKVMDYLDRPGAASRAAIMAGVRGQNPLTAFGEQFTESSEKAPSGADIAETVGEKFDIQNPYALAGLATLADLTDPTNLVPGGILKKAPKAMKAISGAKKLDMPKPTNVAQMMKERAAAGKTGSMVLDTGPKGIESLSDLRLDKVKKDAGLFDTDEEALDFLEKLRASKSR